MNKNIRIIIINIIVVLLFIVLLANNFFNDIFKNNNECSNDYDTEVSSFTTSSGLYTGNYNEDELNEDSLEVYYSLYLYENGRYVYEINNDNKISGHIGNYNINNNKLILNHLFDIKNDSITSNTDITELIINKGSNVFVVKEDNYTINLINVDSKDKSINNYKNGGNNSFNYYFEKAMR